MSKSQLVVAMGVLAALYALASGWLSPVSIETAADLNTTSATAQKQAAKQVQSQETHSKLLQLRTFRGATVDGALRSDHRNHLIIDMQLRHWIDFHLSAYGELSIAEITDLMVQQIQQLPLPAKQQAEELLAAYLGYLQALAGYDAELHKRLTQPTLSDLEARILWQQRLRREWLEPAVVSAFFAGDEEIDLYTLEQQRLRQQGATPEQLAALEQMLPEPVQAMRKESRQIINSQTHEQSLREQGASKADIHAWRTQEYGAQAAQRLAALDQQQATWRARLENYQTYQHSSAVQSLSPSQRASALEDYRQQHFSSNEQKRLPAALQLLAD